MFPNISVMVWKTCENFFENFAKRYPGDVMIFFCNEFYPHTWLDWLKNCKREFDGRSSGYPTRSRISHAQRECTSARTHMCVRVTLRKHARSRCATRRALLHCERSGMETPLTRNRIVNLIPETNKVGKHIARFSARKVSKDNHHP